MNRCALLLVPLLLAACSPTFNWREVQPEGSGLSALFPCKPRSETRPVPLAGPPVPMTFVACSTGGATFALGHADVGAAERVAPALRAWREAAVAKLQGAAQPAASSALPAAEALELSGHLPDGRAARERLLLFSRGTRVYQATVIGERLDAEAVDTFLAGLKPTS